MGVRAIAENDGLVGEGSDKVVRSYELSLNGRACTQGGLN